MCVRTVKVKQFPQSAESYLLCRWGCNSQRCIVCWHSAQCGHITVNLSSRFLTSRLEGRHWCNCSRWRSTGQKSCSFKKLLKQWKQYVWPHGVSIGFSKGCRQMWQTSSSSTSSWYSYKWESWLSCCWPHSLQTRAHDRPTVLLPLTLVSVVAIIWESSVQFSVSGKDQRALISSQTLLVYFTSLRLHSHSQIHSSSEAVYPESKMLSPHLHVDSLLRQKHS